MDAVQVAAGRMATLREQRWTTTQALRAKLDTAIGLTYQDESRAVKELVIAAEKLNKAEEGVFEGLVERPGDDDELPSTIPPDQAEAILRLLSAPDPEPDAESA